MTNTIRFEACDLSGQRFDISQAPADASVGEVVQSLVRLLSLTQLDADGQPIAYEARLERGGSEGVLLRPADRVGDVLKEADRVRVQPSIEAGRGAYVGARA